MQLSELHDQINFLTNTTTTEYSDSDMSTNLTRYAHLLTTEVLDAQDGWDFQMETATADLVDNQREYPFPTDLLTIKKVQLYLDDDWIEATPFDVSETSKPISSETDITDNFSNGDPFIDIGDKSIFIYSGTIAAETAGIKIWYTEEIVGKDNAGDDITSFSTDSDTPNLREAFQRGLIYGACLDYFNKFEMYDQANNIEAKLEKIILRMKKFYGQRVKDRKYRMMSSLSMEDYE